MQHVETIAIDRPVADVWTLVGDPSNWSRWMPDLTDVKLDGEVRTGARLSYTWRGKKRDTTITRFIQGQEIAVRGEEPTYDFTESITVRGMGTMTNVSLSMGFEAKVWWGTALTPFLIAVKKVGMGRPMRKSLNALSREAEAAKRQVAA